MKVTFGDILTLVLALSLALAAALYSFQGMPTQPVVAIRAENRDFLYPLEEDRTLVFQGPLGPSVVEIMENRVRVKEDPSPRQLAVNQGWISEANQTLIVLPNALFIRILGPVNPDALDALAF